MRYYFKVLIVAVLSVLSSAPLFAQGIEPDVTVKYADRDTCVLYMDIYEPDASKVTCEDGKQRPTIVHVFGGGFKEGSRAETWLRPWFREMNAKGYRMITIDYRLGLKGVRGVTQSEFARLLDNAINIAVEDLFSATEYLLKNGASMGIDPNNIVVTGSSAGAIIVQQAEWEICNSTPMAAGLPKGFNYKGVMAFAGAVLVDGSLGYKSAPCPVMMFHGTEDELVPYDVIRTGKVSFCGPCQIQKALESAGGICRFYRFPGINHSVAGYMPQTVGKQVDFIENTVMRGSAERVDAEIVDSSLPTYKTGNDNELYDIQSDTDVAETRWKIGKGGRGILWNASVGLPHEDHIEMTGEKVSCVLRWGVTADHAFRCEKSLVFPMLRTIPNNTHASMNFRIAADIPSIRAVNGRSLIREKVDSVRINGMVEVTSLWSKANDFIGIGPGAVESACIRMTRTIFPSTTLPAVYERFTLKNITGDNLLVTVPQFCQTASTDHYAGVDGTYLVRAEIDGDGTAWMAPGAERTFTVVYQAYREGGKVTSPLLAGAAPVTRDIPAESPLHPDVDSEFAARQAFVLSLGSNLVLDTPDSVLNEMFRQSKIRATESIFRTKGGLMHGPGGESYYAAIWANDQAEYVNPFFPYLGYEVGNASAINSFRQKMVEIPYVTGYSLRQAKNNLEMAGLGIDKLIYRSDLATNYVLEERYNGKLISSGSKLEAEVGSGVTLVVGKGTDAEPQSVPRLVGFSAREAKSRLWEAGFNVGKISYEEGVTLLNEKNARVRTQSPGVGTRREYGTSVSFTLSLDEEQIEKGRAEAERAAKAAAKAYADSLTRSTQKP